MSSLGGGVPLISGIAQCLNHFQNCRKIYGNLVMRVTKYWFTIFQVKILRPRTLNLHQIDYNSLRNILFLLLRYMLHTSIVKSSFHVHLINGTSPWQGRLEIFYQDAWTSVCDDEFDINEGDVVCHQLGHDYAVEVKFGAFFGKGNGNIWINNLDCFGNETSLRQCRKLSRTGQSCLHDEDVGLMCNNFTGMFIYVLLSFEGWLLLSQRWTSIMQLRTQHTTFVIGLSRPRRG